MNWTAPKIGSNGLDPRSNRVSIAPNFIKWIVSNRSDPRLYRISGPLQKIKNKIVPTKIKS